MYALRSATSAGVGPYLNLLKLFFQLVAYFCHAGHVDYCAFADFIYCHLRQIIARANYA